MPAQNYAILRVARIKSRSDLHGATRHGRREDTGQHFDRARTPFNRHWGANRVIGPVDWAEAFDCGLKRLGAECRRGAPVAAEFFVGTSPEYFLPADPSAGPFDMSKVQRWEDATIAAFYELFGEAVLGARLDLDEASPHMTVIVLPVYRKVTKHSTSTVVSYRKVLGGESKDDARQKMIGLQDWYAEKMAPLGLRRGVSKALTDRPHLTHQEYARKRRREDDERKAALHLVEQRADELAVRLEEIELDLAAAKAERISADEAARKSALILAEAKRSYTFMANLVRSISSINPHLGLDEALDKKADVFERWENHVAELDEEIEAIAPRRR